MHSDADQHEAQNGSPVSDGFTLLELCIVLGIISILASLAIPAMQHYIYRAQIGRAVAEIRMLEKKMTIFYNETEGSSYPPSLNAIDEAGITDPWGNPYRYQPISGAIPGQVRKDRFLVPLNSDYDLYSVGRDGKSQPPLTAAASRDDIVRANNGEFVGLAQHF